jgi:predicted CXXCH cytochrome family protein
MPVPNGRGNPQALHNMTNGDLAGGNFYYVADGHAPDYAKGHNVAGISNRDFGPGAYMFRYMDVPPGFIGSVKIPGGSGPVSWNQQLTCSGASGCHGDRNIADPLESIKGAHHADDSVIDGLTVGTSYRFLYGVKGKEHRNWEYNATSNNHNGYKGDSDYNAMDTISYLCGQCHGQFHPNSNLGQWQKNFYGWHRHPVDISFSAVKGGYPVSEYRDYTTYSLKMPVAYMNPTGAEVTVDTNSIVMCLSCHRAHASPYRSMLRFDYSSMVNSGNIQTGCFTCHTQKKN